MAVLLERIANGAFLRHKLVFAYCAIAVALFVLASNDMGLAGKAVENGSRFELDQCIYNITTSFYLRKKYNRACSIV